MQVGLDLLRDPHCGEDVMATTIDQRSNIADIERRAETIRLQVEAVREATVTHEVYGQILPKLDSMATCAVRIAEDVARLAASLK